MKHRRLLSYILCFIALAAICFITCGGLDIFKCSVNYVQNYRSTIYGETNQSVFLHGNASSVTVEPDLGYEFVGWSDGVESATRNDENITSDISASPVCEIVGLDVPVISISTYDRYPIFTDAYYVDCEVTVTNGGDYDMEDISAEIRVRGNSSKQFDKKSYRLKFDKKRSMFGSDYKAKSWNLIANHNDKSLSRNMIAYTLSDRLENIDFTSAYTYVEVFLNDEYMGVYGFCDKVGVGDGRVDISEDVTSSGGGMSYLIELNASIVDTGVEGIDYFYIGNKSYEIKSPELSDVENAAEIGARIKASVEECYSAAQSLDYATANEYLDLESFAETYIVNEIMGNPDVFYNSFYLYKDADGKLTSGPVWDYDIAAGNAYDLTPYTSLMALEWNYWYAALFDISEFREMVKEKFVYYKDVILETIELADPENESGIYAKYGQAMERNFEKWQIMGKYVWPEPQNVYEIDTVTGQLSFLENWLTERYYFVCNQYGVEL